jgi:hypothetical protein
MATVCWRNIYKIRAGKISKQQKLTGGIKAELEQGGKIHRFRQEFYSY